MKMFVAHVPVNVYQGAEMGLKVAPLNFGRFGASAPPNEGYCHLF